MLRILSILPVVACLLVGEAAWAQEGKLQRVRDEVRPAKTEEKEEDCCCDRDDGIELDPVTGQIFLMALATPFVVPAS